MKAHRIASNLRKMEIIAKQTKTKTTRHRAIYQSIGRNLPGARIGNDESDRLISIGFPNKVMLKSMPIGCYPIGLSCAIAVETRSAHFSTLTNHDQFCNGVFSANASGTFDTLNFRIMNDVVSSMEWENNGRLVCFNSSKASPSCRSLSPRHFK